jgi:hypothetical protein
MVCFTILGIPSFDCFCTIPIVFTIIIGSLLAMGRLMKG